MLLTKASLKLFHCCRIKVEMKVQVEMRCFASGIGILV